MLKQSVMTRYTYCSCLCVRVYDGLLGKISQVNTNVTPQSPTSSLCLLSLFSPPLMLGHFDSTLLVWLTLTERQFVCVCMRILFLLTSPPCESLTSTRFWVTLQKILDFDEMAGVLIYKTTSLQHEVAVRLWGSEMGRGQRQLPLLGCGLGRYCEAIHVFMSACPKLTKSLLEL